MWLLSAESKAGEKYPVGSLGGPFLYVSHAEADQNEEDADKDCHSGDTESNYRCEQRCLEVGGSSRCLACWIIAIKFGVILATSGLQGVLFDDPRNRH